MSDMQFGVNYLVRGLNLPYGRERLMKDFDAATRKLERTAVDAGCAPDWTTLHIQTNSDLDRLSYYQPGNREIHMRVKGHPL